MLLAMKDEAGSNLKDEENDFMLNNSYGDETLEELTAAVIMMARIQLANDNAKSEPSYNAKAISESTNLKELQQEEVQEMLNTFKSMEQKVAKKSPKENVLQNEIDLLLEVSLTREIQDCVESSNSVRRPKSKDTKLKDRVLKNTNVKRSHAHVQKMSSSVSIDSNKCETMNSTKWVAKSSTLPSAFISSNAGLEHDLFLVGQFCDGDLEVAFRSNMCYVWNLEGDDLLTESLESNLYTISISELAAYSPAQNLKIKTDNGTKFKNEKLRSSYAKLGIVHNTSIARMPQQNGIVERRNHTLMEAARTMLIFLKTPQFLWAEAIATACFTQNRSIIHTRYNKTPYELIRGRKPNIQYFHVFGSLCYLATDRDDFGKMKPKADIVPSKTDLDNLFGPLYKEYYATSTPEVSNKSVANTRDNKDTFSSSSIIIEEDEAPQIVSSSQELVHTGSNNPVLNEHANKQNQEDVVELDGNTIMHTFEIPEFGDAESSSNYQDPSNMHEIFINQSQYTMELLRKHGMEKCDTITTLIATTKIDADLQGTPTNQTKYHSMIGGLMYLTYSNDTGSELRAYSDADLAGCLDDYKSTFGGIQFLRMRTQLLDYGFRYNKIPMYRDSKSAIAISCNLVQHSHTKQINIRYHFIKEHVEKCTIELYFVEMEYQLADLFTKALPRERFEYLVPMIVFHIVQQIIPAAQLVPNFQRIRICDNYVVLKYPRFIKLSIAELIKKFSSIPPRLVEDYHSIKDDILLVSVYTMGNVTVRGMLILDAFFTKEIRATDDYKEYETVFVNVAVLMNQPQLVKQVVIGEKVVELYADKFDASMIHDDVDDSNNRLEPGSHKENPKHVDDDDDEKEEEKKDDKMGSLKIRTEKMQTPISITPRSPRINLSSDKNIAQ
uniref:Retrovirus-related Pol polyprotein from transposon TNT 1-94 n=1 Tax=Tanacetum cinerariifolium TaxID=118510 RepID=A0A6L2JPR9_TANCI|nr:retrovirus-related Pol polyprotein from transposon TNT 1-94 [Tanacetum cinerariifolium]